MVARVFAPTSEEKVPEGYRILHSEELHIFHAAPDITSENESGVACTAHEGDEIYILYFDPKR
jgi:hypothetical protein